MTISTQAEYRGNNVNRTRLLTGFLTALALIAGSVVATSIADAGPSCSASKTAARTINAVETASADEATPVEATKANVTTAGDRACCASGKNATLTSAKTKVAKAGASCNLATSKGCDYSATKTGYADARLMDGETVLAKLAHCGIDVRSADADFLAASLVKRECGKYSLQQWATMIKAARSLEVEDFDAILAGATSASTCDGADKCPMTLVVGDLAAQKEETTRN